MARKISVIARDHVLSEIGLQEWLTQSEYKKYLKLSTLGSLSLAEEAEEAAVADFKKHLEQIEEEQKYLVENKERLEKEAAEEEIRKRDALASMLITSGFNFDGYRITKYSGYISGDDAISVDRGLSVLGFGGGGAADNLMNSLVTIRRNALRELKEAAYDLGCNAVIGVDFDYLILDPVTPNLIGGGQTLQPYVFGVTANGNAVVIERDEAK